MHDIAAEHLPSGCWVYEKMGAEGNGEAGSLRGFAPFFVGRAEDRDAPIGTLGQSALFYRPTPSNARNAEGLDMAEKNREQGKSKKAMTKKERTKKEKAKTAAKVL